MLAAAGALIAAAGLAQTAPSANPAPTKPVRNLPPGTNDPLAQGEGKAVASKLAEELEQNFVYSEVGQRYAAMLRSNAATGRYDLGTRVELADRMTDDLQAVQKDGHLAVRVADPEEGRPGGGPGRVPRNWPPLIQSAKEIAPGIAYIRFTAFMSTDEEVAAVRKFMADHKEAKTIIFDLRNHHGGRLGEMDEIFPYLFAAKTPLVTLEMPRSTFDRHGSPFGDGPTLEMAKDDDHVRVTHVAIPNEVATLRDAKVYLLVSNVTGSAGEHFSLAFKSTGRATLIGEATAGANHFGGPAKLGDHFSAFIPVGRTFDIKTGKDWEGNGVAPDVEVDPKLALVVALEKAGLSHAEAVQIDATEIPAEPVHRDRLRAR
jgi:hypothetical protein